MSKICTECSKVLNKMPRSNYHKCCDVWYCKSCCQRMKHVEEATAPINVAALSRAGANVVRNDTHGTLENNSRGEVILDINRSIISSKCVFGCEAQRSLRRLSNEECLNIYITTNIFVHYGSRACYVHGMSDAFEIDGDGDGCKAQSGAAQSGDQGGDAGGEF